jgi:DNA-binding response OmpR family regulator
MRVLVVEDEHKIASAVKKGLEQETYSVDLAYDGIEAYDLASSEEYDAILLDIMLPGLDGVEVCRKLRQNKIHTPIIMLTAKSETEDKVKGLDYGADDYLTKPFSFEELLARLRAVLRRPQIEQPEVFKCADLELNTKTFETKRGGIAVILSRREFQLLEYLIKNKNKILTKDQIISHVWNYESDILPNTVEQHIKYLRDKIEAPFKGLPHLIITVRGFGYKLVGD